MATYLELFGLTTNGDLRNRVAVAVAVAADTIRSEDPGTPNHAARLTWAARSLSDPMAIVRQVLWAVLAANASATPAQITGATDAQIQTHVDAAVDVFAALYT